MAESLEELNAGVTGRPRRSILNGMPSPRVQKILTDMLALSDEERNELTDLLSAAFAESIELELVNEGVPSMATPIVRDPCSPRKTGRRALG